MSNIIKFGIIQNNLSNDFKSNLKEVLRLSNKIYNKVDFIVFSEYFLGWVEDHKTILSTFKKEAIKNHINFILGSIIETHKGKKYNTCFLIDKNGKIRGKYRKIHLYKKWENKITSGKLVKIFNMDRLKIGIVICLDVYFPKEMIKLIEADIIIVPSMTSSEEIDDHICVLKTRAIDNLTPLILLNAVGTLKMSKDLIRWGGKSSYINAEGRIINQTGDKEGYKIFRVSLNETQVIRKKLSKILNIKY